MPNTAPALRIAFRSSLFIVILGSMQSGSQCLARQTPAAQDSSAIKKDPVIVKRSLFHKYHAGALGQIYADNCSVGILRIPRLLRIFGDRMFMSQIGVAPQHAKHVRDKLKQIQSTVKTSTAAQFSQSVESLLNEAKGGLNRKQLEACESALLAWRFYELGPVGFAEEIGESPIATGKLATGCRRYSTEFAATIKNLQDEITLEFFELSPKLAATGIRGVLKECNPTRLGLLTPLWQSLVEIEERRVAEIDLGFVPTYYVEYSGYLATTEYLKWPVDELSELLVLVATQNWELINDKSMEAFLILQNEIKADLDSQHATAYTAAHEKHSKGALTKSQFDEEAKRLRKDRLRKHRDLRDDILSGLTESERHHLNRAIFLSMLSRKGPTILLSPECKKLIGVQLTKNEFDGLSEKAKRLRQKLSESAMELQKQFYIDVIDPIDELNKENFEWMISQWHYSIPPLEVLVDFCIGP